MSLESIFRADNFYALSLAEAHPELERLMISYLGIFPIVQGERPQTDGKKIFLEGRKTDFKDDKSDFSDNRNMSLYLSDLIHELLHISKIRLDSINKLCPVLITLGTILSCKIVLHLFSCNHD